MPGWTPNASAGSDTCPTCCTAPASGASATGSFSSPDRSPAATVSSKRGRRTHTITANTCSHLGRTTRWHTHAPVTPVEPGREAVELAVGFLARTVELTADTVREIDGGLAVATPSLPEVWNLNHVRLLTPLPWHSALELADQHLRHVRFRHLIAEDAIAREWADAPREDGFQIEREVMMVIEGKAPAEPDGKAPAEPEGRRRRNWRGPMAQTWSSPTKRPCWRC